MAGMAFSTNSLGPSTLNVAHPSSSHLPLCIDPAVAHQLSCHVHRALVAISAQGGELSSAGGCQLLHPCSLVGERRREIIFGYMVPLWHTTRTRSLIRICKTATLLNHTGGDVTSREINDVFAPRPRLKAKSGRPNPRRRHRGPRILVADCRYKDMHTMASLVVEL